MASDDESVPEDVNQAGEDDLGAGEWQVNLALVRLAAVALKKAQRELAAAGCHKTAKPNARERGARRIFNAFKEADVDMTSLEELLDCTRDSALIFKVIATSLSDGGAKAGVMGLCADPLCDRVLVAEQAILMNGLFLERRAEEFHRDVSAFTKSPPGADLDPLGEAVMHSLHELRVSMMAGNHMVAEFNAALKAWRSGKHIGELAMGCIATARGIN